ncbi:MAG: response regulator [Lachnospiraceae bacterium]|nr:response regulator [Lachnospiraceae bacterium]
MNMTENNAAVRKLFLSHSEQILDEMLDKANILTFVYYPKEQRYEGLKLPKGFGVAPESGERFTESFVALFKMVPMHELLFREAVRAIDEGSATAGCTIEIRPEGISVWIHLRFIAFLGENGETDHCIAFASDVTAIKMEERIFADQMIRGQSLQGKIINTSCFNVSQDRLVTYFYGGAAKGQESERPERSVIDAILESNPGAREQRSETQDALVLSASQIPYPDERNKFTRVCSRLGLLKAFEEGRTEQTLEYRRIIGGKLTWVSTMIVLVRHPETDELFAFFYTTDISINKQAERLKDANNIMQLAALDINDMIAVIDPVEETIELFYGTFFRRGEQTYDGVKILPLSDYVKRVTSKYLSPEEGGRFRERFDISNIENELKKKTELLFAVDCVEDNSEIRRKLFRLIKREDGGEGIIVSKTDITDIYAKERQLEIDDVIMKKTIAETVDFVAVLDPETSEMTLRFGSWILKKNGPTPNLHMTVEYDRFVRWSCSAVGDDNLKKKYNEQLSLASVTEKLSEDQEVMLHIDMVDPLDKKCTYKKQIRYSRLDYNDGKLIVIGSDVTKSVEEEKERNRQMAEALESAKAADRAKLDFISRISHDIRTPLSAVKNMTEFAYRDMEDPDRLRHDLDSIKHASAFLNSLINDVLDISKIDSGQIEIHEETYPYGYFMEEFQSLIEMEAKRKNITIEFEGDCEDIPIMTDPVRWRQIGLNIVMNALKYTPSGGNIFICVTNKRLDEHTAICKMVVEDTGIGMSENFKKHMFEPFSQDEENEERRKISGGTGLGLYIVKRLTELMGGTVEIESELGKGTRVTLFIKAKIAETDPYEEKNDDFNVELSGRVLLVEDNEINTEIALRILDATGVECEHACDGIEALEMYESREPGYYDAIIMDIQMPRMNGYEAAAAIRSSGRGDADSIPVIAMTADAFDDAKKKAKEAGFTSYITKPLDADVVKRVLAETVISNQLK